LKWCSVLAVPPKTMEHNGMQICVLCASHGANVLLVAGVGAAVNNNYTMKKKILAEIKRRLTRENTWLSMNKTELARRGNRARIDELTSLSEWIKKNYKILSEKEIEKHYTTKDGYVSMDEQIEGAKWYRKTVLAVVPK